MREIIRKRKGSRFLGIFGKNTINGLKVNLMPDRIFWRYDMNIAKIMIPKVSTVFLHEKDTIRQGLERFVAHGYTAVPVLNENDQYVGSVTEGDFLRHIMKTGLTDKKAHEQYKIESIVRRDFCPALTIDADIRDVISAALNQNFLPIVDDRGALCGILTRRVIIEYLARQQNLR